MTLRELLKVMPGLECVRVYNHGIIITGYVCYFDLECECKILNKEVSGMKKLKDQKILIILK